MQSSVIARKSSEYVELQDRYSALEVTNAELSTEMESVKARETEMLELTQKITGRNAELQSENSVLTSKVNSESKSVSVTIKMHSILSFSQ